MVVPLVAASGWIRARLPLSVSHVYTAKVPTNSVPRKLAGADVLARESQVCAVLSPSGAFCVIRPNAVPPLGRDASFSPVQLVRTGATRAVPPCPMACPSTRKCADSRGPKELRRGVGGGGVGGVLRPEAAPGYPEPARASCRSVDGSGGRLCSDGLGEAGAGDVRVLGAVLDADEVTALREGGDAGGAGSGEGVEDGAVGGDDADEFAHHVDRLLGDVLAVGAAGLAAGEVAGKVDRLVAGVHGAGRAPGDELAVLLEAAGLGAGKWLPWGAS